MKTTKRSFRRMLAGLFFGSMMLLPLAACERNDGPFEEVGEEIDDAIDEVSDEVEDAVDEVDGNG